MKKVIWILVVALFWWVLSVISFAHDKELGGWGCLIISQIWAAVACAKDE
jgi:hypothetical protein